MRSRLGTKLITAGACAIILIVGIVSAVTIFTSAVHTDELMSIQAGSGMKSLLGEVQNQEDRLDIVYDIISAVLNESDTVDLDAIWSSQKGTDSDFMALYDASGTIRWQSDNYNLTSFSVNTAGREGYMGIVVDEDAGLTLQVVEPFIQDGSPSGFIIIGMCLTEDSWLDKLSDENDCEFTIFNGNTRYATTILDGNKRVVGTTMADNVNSVVLKSQQKYTGTADILGQKYFVQYEPMKDINGKVVGAYFAGISAAESDQMISKMIMNSVIISVVIAAVALLGIAIALRKMINQPILLASNLATDMSEGNLSGDAIKGAKFNNDEIGDFVQKLHETGKSLAEYIYDIKNVLTKVADGDLTVKPSVQYKGEFLEIQAALDDILLSLNQAMGDVEHSATEVRNGAAQLADGSARLSRSATEQAAAVDEITSTLTDVKNKTEHNTDSIRHALKAAEYADDQAKTGAVSMTDMLKAIDDIEQSAMEISNIMKVINDIAAQTNILAINASIEAARAGDAGRGFAVVAEEVRTLAGESADAAKHTSELVEKSIAAVKTGTELAKSTADSLDLIVKACEAVSTAMGEISEANDVQASAITQVTVGMESVNSAIHATTVTSEESATESEELSALAESLNETVAKFKLEG